MHVYKNKFKGSSINYFGRGEGLLMNFRNNKCITELKNIVNMKITRVKNLFDSTMESMSHSCRP